MTMTLEIEDVTPVPAGRLRKNTYRSAVRVIECHQVVTGARCRITLYEPKWDITDLSRANEIAVGHFDAKARAEAKAL